MSRDQISVSAQVSMKRPPSYVFGILFGLLFIGCQPTSTQPELPMHPTETTAPPIQWDCDSFPIPFTSDLIINFQKGQPWPPIQHCLSFSKQEWNLALAPVGYPYIHVSQNQLEVTHGDAVPGYKVTSEKVNWGPDTLEVIFTRRLASKGAETIREYHQLILTSDTLFHFFFETPATEPFIPSSTTWKPDALKMAFPNTLHSKPTRGMRVDFRGRTCHCVAHFSCEL
jgi:hypothetical protein